MSGRTARRIRVLHVIDALGVGGTELGLANIIERTRSEVGHTVCAIRAGGATAARLAALGIHVIVLRNPPGHDWWLALRLARVCRQVAPQIVHTRNWGSVDGIMGARMARVPVVIHGEHGREASDPNGTNRRRNRARRLLSVFVDRIVAVSEQLGRWLVDEVGVRVSKVTVLKNGVDAQKFRQSYDRAALRRCYGYGPKDVVVGTVGRLDPVKNQVVLLEVLSALLPRYPQMRAFIVGDGPEKRVLARNIAERGLQDTATLLGHRDDVPAVLSMLDIFVLPSLGEGLCNAILEAMAAGLPVVATCVGGNPELVLDGITGQLVPSGDAGALAQAIGRYAADENLRRGHGTAGRERVLQEFTVEQMAKRYVSMYEHELERKR